MKLQEGPAFGALIIGGGIGFLINQKTQNMQLALLVGTGIAIADYVVVVAIKSFTERRR